MFRFACLILSFVFLPFASLCAQENTANVTQLIEGLKNTNPLEVRIEAATQLEKLGPDAKAAVNALIQALKDTDYQVRCKAAGALSKIGADAYTSVGKLIDTLVNDDNEDVRRMCTEALGSIGSQAKQAIPDLIKKAEDTNEDSNIRAAALRALGNIGGSANRCVPVITKLMEDPNPNLRYNALQALRNFKYYLKDEAHKVEKMLKGDDPPIRLAAASMSWELEDRAGPVVRILIDIAGDAKEKPELRSKSIISLTNLTRKTIIPHKGASQTSDPLTVEVSKSMPILLRILKDKNEARQVRISAIEAVAELSLGELLSREGEISVLEPLIASLKEPDERPLAKNAIETICQGSRSREQERLTKS